MEDGGDPVVRWTGAERRAWKAKGTSVLQPFSRNNRFIFLREGLLDPFKKISYLTYRIQILVAAENVSRGLA